MSGFQNPQTGLTRTNAAVSITARHDTLYRKVSVVNEVTQPTKPVMAFVRNIIPKPSDTVLLSTTANRKKLDRNIRNVQRGQILETRKRELLQSGMINSARVSGVKSVKARNYRPNLPDGFTGLQVDTARRDMPLRGGFGIHSSIPASVAAKVSKLPVATGGVSVGDKREANGINEPVLVDDDTLATSLAANPALKKEQDKLKGIGAIGVIGIIVLVVVLMRGSA